MSVSKLASDLSALKLDEKLGNDIGDGKITIQHDSEEEKKIFKEFQIKAEPIIALTFASEHWQLACLRARKYDIDRAVTLLEKYMKWRDDFKVDEITPQNDEEFSAQLKNGMFRCPGNVDKEGRTILYVDISKHDPSRWNATQTVRCLHYIIANVLRNFPETQSRGIIVVNDLTNVTMSHIDVGIPKEIFNAFSSKFPLRFGGGFICQPPFFFKLVFPIVKMLMKKKFQDRVVILNSTNDLINHISPDQLLEQYQGNVKYEHEATINRYTSP